MKGCLRKDFIGNSSNRKYNQGGFGSDWKREHVLKKIMESKLIKYFLELFFKLIPESYPKHFNFSVAGSIIVTLNPSKI